MPRVGRELGRPSNKALGAKDFSWIRSDNSESARAARRAFARATQEAVIDRGFHVPRVGFVKLSHVTTMMRFTKCISPSRGNLRLPSASGRHPSTSVSSHASFALEAVVELSRTYGDKVAVVSAASAYHCGGGFLTGGRHALEEAVCVQTALFDSLVAVQEGLCPGAPKRTKPGEMYIPTDGCILSPKVEVFRQGSSDGYAYMDRPVLLGAVLSIAMFNHNRMLRDAPVDAPRTAFEYDDAVRAKFRAMLAGALEADCVAIVVPDVGCGVYGNDPKIVGRLLGEVVRQEFWGCLEEIVVVGGQDFKDSVIATIANPECGGHPRTVLEACGPMASVKASRRC